MVTTERREKTYLIRTHQQLAVAPPDKPTNVAADKRLTRQTEGREHRNIEREGIPGAVCVAGPHRCVTLNACIRRARDDEWSPVRLQSLESFVSRARHQQGEGVPVFRVSCFLTFIETDDVQLVLAGLIDEVRRFVHVRPDAGNAIVGVHTMQVAPPPSCFGQSVVDKNTVTRPDARHKQIAIPAALKVVLFETLIESVITLILIGRMLYTRIDYRDDLYAEAT